MSVTSTFTSATAGLGKVQLLNAFEIFLIGFLFVFFILLLLSLVTSFVGKIFVRIPAKASSSPVVTGTEMTAEPEKSPASSKNIADDFVIEESNPHHIAVIAAAIHFMMEGRRHRIVSIRSGDSSWAAEGRRQIFSSRKVR